MTDPVFLFDPDTDDVPVNGDGLNAGWTITLPASVKRHALGAMRLAEGDGLSLTDGRGLCVKTTLVDAQAGLVSVERVGRQPQPVTRLVLIQALAKTGHDEAAIDMATQIGVDEVIPWQANRSIAKWKAGRTDRKWRQVLDAATEQSRRVWSPELAQCVSSKQVVAICRRACVHGDLVIVLHVAPFLCGRDVVRGVRPAGLRRPLFYVVSWLQSEQAVLSLLECGVDQYMAFPLSLQRLRGKVSNDLNRLL